VVHNGCGNIILASPFSLPASSLKPSPTNPFTDPSCHHPATLSMIPTHIHGIRLSRIRLYTFGASHVASTQYCLLLPPFWHADTQHVWNAPSSLFNMETCMEAQRLLFQLPRPRKVKKYTKFTKKMCRIEITRPRPPHPAVLFSRTATTSYYMLHNDVRRPFTYLVGDAAHPLRPTICCQSRFSRLQSM
jgi:hypothetical protein